MWVLWQEQSAWLLAALICPKGKRGVLRRKNMTTDVLCCVFALPAAARSQWGKPLQEHLGAQHILQLCWLSVSIPQLHDAKGKSSGLPAAKEEELICRCCSWHLEQSCVPPGCAGAVNTILRVARGRERSGGPSCVLLHERIALAANFH